MPNGIKEVDTYTLELTTPDGPVVVSSAIACRVEEAYRWFVLAKAVNPTQTVGTLWATESLFRDRLTKCFDLLGIPNPERLTIPQIQELLFDPGYLWGLQFLRPKRSIKGVRIPLLLKAAYGISQRILLLANWATLRFTKSGA